MNITQARYAEISHFFQLSTIWNFEIGDTDVNYLADYLWMGIDILYRSMFYESS